MTYFNRVILDQLKRPIFFGCFDLSVFTVHATFDVTMGSFDGADVCELVGLYALNNLRKSFGNNNIG